MNRRGWHRKFGNFIYDAQERVVVIFEAPGKTQEEWDRAFRTGSDLIRWINADGKELREMLKAMQCGEMTVSRGIELIDMWMAGNYSDELLPPIDDGVVGEDETPIEIINRLRDEVEQLKQVIASRNSL